MVSNVEPDSSSLSDASDILYQSCASESAKICIQSAMQLLEVLSRTYKTPTTITWWWAGLCKCEADACGNRQLMPGLTVADSG